MRGPGLVPIVCAVALTIAAGLAIAAKHACSFHAEACGAPIALPAPQRTGDADFGSTAAGIRVASQAKGSAAAVRSPASARTR
jgi:hypothetical protein